LADRVGNAVYAFPMKVMKHEPGGRHVGVYRSLRRVNFQFR
jgi:hypothetical protein